MRIGMLINYGFPPILGHNKIQYNMLANKLQNFVNSIELDVLLQFKIIYNLLNNIINKTIHQRTRPNIFKQFIRAALKYVQLLEHQLYLCIEFYIYICTYRLCKCNTHQTAYYNINVYLLLSSEENVSIDQIVLRSVY